MSSAKYTPLPTQVSEQPKSAAMDLNAKPIDSEKAGHGHQHGQACHCEAGDGHQHMDSAQHRRCHNSRLRRFLVPLFAAFMVLIGLLAVGCLYHGRMSDWGMEDLIGRAVGDGSSSGNQSPFIKNKLWLIVLLVGIVVVFILAIMLSAWCCRGAFENPLCCPCYLCACCGGLACLECIGCGLCADAADQM